MHEGSREREPLLPASRELAGEALPVGVDRGEPDGPLAALGQLGPLEAVDRREEVEVLENGEVLVEREPLRNVSDAPADLFAVRHHVQAVDPGASLRRREETAEDPDERRLAGAVRTEEPVDLAARNAERDAVEGPHLAEVARHPLDLDPVIARRIRHQFSTSRTVAAMPGRSSGARSIATFEPKHWSMRCTRVTTLHGVLSDCVRISTTLPGNSRFGYVSTFSIAICPRRTRPSSGSGT